MTKLICLFILFVMLVQPLVCTSLVSKSFDQLDPNLSVALVNDYLTAIIWKNVSRELNLQTTTDVINMLKQQNTLRIAYIPSNSKMGLLWKSVSSSFYKNLGLVTFYAFLKGYCHRYHILEDFDMIITSRNLFLEKFRIYQKGSGKRTSIGHVFETNDFDFINLHPFSVYQVDEGASALNVSFSFQRPSCESTLTTFDYEPSLLNSFQIANIENSTVSNFDMECLKNWNKFQIKTLSITTQQVIRNEIFSTFGFQSNSSKSLLESLYLPSSCHNCLSEVCSDIITTDIEFWLIPQTLVIVIHFLLLFLSGALKQPSVKRRMFTPYLPICIVICIFPMADMFWSICNMVSIGIGVIVNFTILVHFFTYIRFYYLRNLYRVFSISKKVNHKLHFLSGIVPGMLFTTIFPLLLCWIVSLPYISMYFLVNLSPSLVFNINLAISIGVTCIMGLVVIIIDLVLNRKKWKEKGLRYMLFFDYPFLIRIDMLLLTINILVIILIATLGDTSRHAAYFFRMMAFAIFCLVSGGSCVIKVLIDKAKGISMKHNEDEEPLENYLKQDDFKLLLREYCVKELSLENYNFYMVLMELQTKANSRLTKELMDEIEKEYFSSVSTFELNVSNSCRKSFHSLRKNIEDEMKSSTTELLSKDDAADSSGSISNQRNSYLKIQELITIFNIEVLSNLRDTFMRMSQTYEFNMWLQAFKIQKQNNIC